MIALVKLPEIMDKEKFEQIVEQFPTFVANINTRVGVKKEFGVTSYKVLEEGEYLTTEVVAQGGEYHKDDEQIKCYNVYAAPQCPMIELRKSYGLVNIEQFAKVAVGVPIKILEVYGR